MNSNNGKMVSTATVFSLMLFCTSVHAQEQPAATNPNAGSTSIEETPTDDRELPPPISRESLITKYQLPTLSPGEEMTLAQALIAADKRNLTLTAIRTDIENAQAQLKYAWGSALPVINAKMDYTVHDHEDTMSFTDSLGDIPGFPPMDDIPPTVTMEQHDLRGGIEAAMPLFNLQTWYSIRVAKIAVELTDLSVEAMRQQLLLNVAEAYFSALMAGQLIELQMNTIISFDQHLEISKAMFAAGTGLRLDVVRAQTDLETAKQQLISANLLYDNARDALSILTGSQGLPVPVETAPINVPQGTDKELIKQGLSKRPDIQANRAAITVNQTQLKTSYMQYLPYIDAFWQGTYQFTDPGEMGSDDRSRMMAMFTLTVPIFNYYRYGDGTSKRAALQKAKLQSEDAALNASMEVRKARRDYLAALASVEVAEKQSLLSREALVLTEASYTAGTGSSLELTDARRNSLQADVDKATKMLEAKISLLRLLYAIGENMAELGN